MAVVSTRRTTLAALAVLSLGVATAAAAGSASAQTGGHRHTVSKASSWAAHAGRSSAVPTKDAVSAKVWLAPRNGAGLTALAAAVSDPSSSQYGQYLSESAYRSQFAPTAAQVSAVESWLKGAGLRVHGVGPDNHFVSVSGSATAINSAFTAGVRQFTVNGVSVLGSTSDVTVPDTLAGDVLAVSGLDTLGHQVQPGATTGLAAKDTPSAKPKPAAGGDSLGPPPGFVNAGPCNASYGVQVDTQDPKFQGSHLPYAVCGYTPSQFRSVYGVTRSGLT
ncbi:MAG: protease pro-enzyme activation domain-containing protein, partial [Nostocoides sp.]